jgi:uncharacterized protein YdeI (YjbR/CyaY-like superfamily)
MKSYSTVDLYVENHPHYREELRALRTFFLETTMQEAVKWGAPIYSVNGKNVAGLAAFKAYVGIWFHQGALLNDPEKKLINAQEGKTQALRQWRFTSLDDIRNNETTIRNYLHEAILNQEQGKEIKPNTKKPLVIAEEMAAHLASHPEAKSAFDNMTPGKRREYADYINEAKRAETKQARLKKITPLILDGVGLNDKYK